MVSVPLGGPWEPRSVGTAATGAFVGGPVVTPGEAVLGGAGTVAGAEGAAGAGSASTAGVGSRGASARACGGDGAGRGAGGSTRGFGGVGDRRARGVGWVAGALAVTGISMTWTSTGLGTTVGVDGCRSSERNAICERTVNRRASGNSYGSRSHGSSRNRIDGMRWALPRRRHREEEVLGAGPAGCEHGLGHDAAGRRAVHRD